MDAMLTRVASAGSPAGKSMLSGTLLRGGLPAFLTVLGGMTLGAGEARALDPPLVFVQEQFGGGDGAAAPGEPSSRIVVRRPDGSLRVLTPEFAAAADPCVSFDATRILFAGKLEPTSPWDIWEMDPDGSRMIRITRDLGDCREPIYLPRAAVDSPSFEEKVRWITFTSTAPGVLDDQGRAALTSLYAMNIEEVPGRGTVLWRTTQNLGGDISPTLLSDGRVLFSAGQRGAHALMAISWAGENLNPFYGSHDGFVSQVAAQELPDRSVVFVEHDASSDGSGGRLARVSLRRPLHSHEVLSPEGELYRTPHPLPGGSIVVSYSDGVGSYGLYGFDLETKGRRGQSIHDDPAWNDVDAIPIVPREEPPGRIPTVEFASVLDVGALRTVGQLQCLNVYDSDRPEAEGIEEGQVRSVRFVQGVPVPLSESDGDDLPLGSSPSAGAEPDSTWPPPGVRTRILGEAPVEDDGSFYVNVAGDIPFYLETLDEEGGVLQTMRAWMWVRAGDQRGCIGCHENKELAPVNRATRALIRARPLTLLPPSDPGAAVGMQRGSK
jgi:hypothetical protein